MVIWFLGAQNEQMTRLDCFRSGNGLSLKLRFVQTVRLCLPEHLAMIPWGVKILEGFVC